MLWVYDDGGRQDAGYRGTASDCTVRAIAIATETPYKEVYDALNGLARTHERPRKGGKRSSSRTGVTNKTSARYLQSLRWRWTPTMGIGTGCKVHLKDGELPPGRLVVSVSRHLVAVVDGVIHDVYDCSRNGTRCVYGYWSR